MIYLSTGHFQENNFYKTALLYKKNNISNIEFSGGGFTNDIRIKLKKLKKKIYLLYFIIIFLFQKSHL